MNIKSLKKSGRSLESTMNTLSTSHLKMEKNKTEIEFPLKLTTKDIYYYMNFNILTLLTHKGYY